MQCSPQLLFQILNEKIVHINSLGLLPSVLYLVGCFVVVVDVVFNILSADIDNIFYIGFGHHFHRLGYYFVRYGNICSFT